MVDYSTEGALFLSGEAEEFIIVGGIVDFGVDAHGPLSRAAAHLVFYF